MQWGWGWAPHYYWWRARAPARIYCSLLSIFGDKSKYSKRNALFLNPQKYWIQSLSLERKTLSKTSTAVCTRGASILLAVNWTSEQCRGWRARQIYSTWRVVILCRLLDRSREIITAKLIRLPPIRRTAHIVASRSSHCRLYKKKHFFCYFWSMHSFSIFVSAWIW